MSQRPLKILWRPDLLKHHTLEEETKLFPIVESLFTKEQLDTVLDFKAAKVL